MPADQRQGGTVNMNDVLPGPGQGQSSDPLMQQQSFRHPSSAGPHQTSFGGPGNPYYGSDFLSVDAPGSIRRVKSESGPRVPNHRQARSLDFTGSLSPNPSGLLFPPPGPAQQDFIRQNSGRFLHPSEPLPSITRGHHRRSSSGSRERGGMMGGMGGVQGWQGSSAASSARASPYPSPSASPRPGYGPLPPQDLGMAGLAGPGMGMGAMGAMGMGGMGMGMGMSGMAAPSLSGQMAISANGLAAAAQMSANAMAAVRSRQGVLQVDMPGADGGAVAMTVTRPHVTTPSTAKASHDRRKQPANFACPVPGCGSTFTRHFNLKGESSCGVSRARWR